MNSDATRPTLALRLSARLLRGLLWLAAIGWLLFGLSWGVLHGIIVPRIGEWRQPLEQAASRALGIPVRIESVRATQTQAIPSFELKGVQLLDRTGRETLVLPQIQVALSARSLWRLGFEQLVIDRPTLEVRRLASGQIQVAGLPLGPAPGQEARLPALDWLLAQPELVIRHGTLHWTDESRPGTGTLSLSDVEGVMRNPGRQHQWRLDATPPGGWGERFSLRGRFAQPLLSRGHSQWSTWSGDWYADTPYLDLLRLRQYIDLPSTVGLDVLQGQGALRTWGRLERGRPTSISTDIAIDQLQLAIGTERSPLVLQRTRGRLDWASPQPQEWSLATQGLQFETEHGTVWPGGNVRLQQRRLASGEWGSTGLQADQLDLGIVHHLAARLPIPQRLRQWLDSLQPEGRLERVALEWSDQRWQVSGSASHLRLLPGAWDLSPTAPAQDIGRPGVEGASLRFEANQDRGQLHLNLAQGALSFPGVFEEPRLELEQLSGDWSWSRSDQGWTVEMPSLTFENADASGQAKGEWRQLSDDPSGLGHLNLQASLSRARADRIYRYLPRSLSASSRAYVQQAIRGGEAQQADFRVLGRLDDFPFEREGSGRFEVHARLQGVDFDYAPAALLDPGTVPWPRLEGVQAELDIQQQRLRIQRASGRAAGLGALQALEAHADIPDLLADQPRLTVQTRITGPGQEALSFVRHSPLRELTAQALDQAKMSGNTELGLTLDLPLDQPADIRVQGRVRFQNNDIQIQPDTPRLGRVMGQLQFTESGFSLEPSTARVLGGELRFSGQMPASAQADRRSVQFQGQGQFTAEGLQGASELGPLAELARSFKGSSSYQLRLGFLPSGTSWTLESPLSGLSLGLPAPLNKSAPVSWPLRIELNPMAQAGQDRLSIDLGTAPVPVLSARFERDSGPQGPHRVIRGSIGLASERPPLPDQGVMALLVSHRLNVSEWTALLPSGPSGASSPPSAGSPTDSGYLPTRFAAVVGELVQDGRQFHDVVLGGSRMGNTWQVNLTAREFDGYAEYQPDAQQGAGRVYARLARMSLPPSARQEVESLLQQNHEDVPALDIEVQQFELAGRALGRLEIRAQHPTSAAGPTTAWRLDTLKLTVPEARLEAQGDWSPQQTGPRVGQTRLNFTLNIQDSGALLARFGMPGVIKAGQGRLTGQLKWSGTPLGLHYPTLAGDLVLDVQRGQFLKAEPGIAKLLGVLSLQSLPRRLTLDFRDVFSDGFAFDSIRGNVAVDKGVASTRNLQMKGVNAAVVIEGTADIARETQQLNVVVVPELDAGTASLLATVVNPSVGLGTWLVQWLLGIPLQKATTQRFEITGTWADPQVKALENRNNQDTSATPSGKQP